MSAMKPFICRSIYSKIYIITSLDYVFEEQLDSGCLVMICLSTDDEHLIYVHKTKTIIPKGSKLDDILDYTNAPESGFTESKYWEPVIWMVGLPIVINTKIFE